MNNEIKEAVDTADKKAYEFRKLGALDIAPMCKIIGKIGITEFGKCFESETVLNLIKQMKGQKNAAQIQDIAGLQVVLEIANIIVCHIPEVEKDIFTLLASVSGLTVDEVRAFDLATFTEMVIDFIKKPEFKDFIGVVSKLFR